MPRTGQLSPGEHLVSGIVLEATPTGVQCSGGGGSDCLTARRCLGRQFTETEKPEQDDTSGFFGF